ncbi:LuxR family transcriptional regulator [Microvirga sp. W0021]|uniref:LuxR family transcriptional regulator n=1 Tax=Hohaiivirga grylli TaxID=3133970 RepID=A0ABV0BHX7_9HYPH
MTPFAFDELVEALNGGCDKRVIMVALRDFAHAYRCEWFAYVDLAGSDIQIFSNYPKEWQSHYLAEGYSLIDPVIMTAKNHIAPFVWDEQTLSHNLSRKQKQFLKEAKKFGIQSGLSIPVYAGFGRTALLTLATSNSAEKLPFVKNPYQATAAATYLHIYLQLIMTGALVGKKYSLTARQLTCLRWAANNKTNSEIGQILNIGESAVRQHLNNAKETLGAGGIKNAIYIATKNFLI